MNFTLKQLRYVEAAGRLGSIAKASLELSISQSSITAAIDQLEREVAFDLFVRTPAKGIRTTPTGEEALSQIRSFINQAKHFEAEMRSIGGDDSGHVRIACYATAAPAFLPPILQNITENFPNMSVQVLEGDLATIAGFLSEGKADLVFTYAAAVPDMNGFQPLFDAPPYALIGVDDPLSSQSSVTFADLVKLPMVLLDLPFTRDYFIGMFETHGLTPNIAHTTRSSEIARALVAGGFGYTILNIRPPDSGADQKQFRAVPIQDATVFQQFGIAAQSGARQPKIVQAFIESCLELQRSGAFENITVWPEGAPKPQKFG